MHGWRTAAAGWLALGLLGFTWPAAAQEARFELPDGFAVEEYAGDEFCHNAYSMTVDALGRVVVAGPGYVRILIDDDQDGKADRYETFSDVPKNGAQGLYFHGRDLLCMGDQGLMRLTDADGNDRADGPPQVFIQFRTGGEHHTHAIRQGPDGWWYVIAGNEAGVNERYVTLPTSPIKHPTFGALVRFRPDLTGGEVVADGMRNAYDFAFLENGDAVTFDSDDERDITLPWYRPTRIFRMLPTVNHGWLSKSWKRTDGLFDSPFVMGEAGRGSPTGVVTYRHTAFPEKYRGGIFALDWTYGRVLFVPADAGREGPVDPEVFARGKDNFGFAPTDAEVAPDGSLFVAVGGRGTRGAVYRIFPRGGASEDWTKRPGPPADQPTEARIDYCVAAPQPLSSWSRVRWQPVARTVPRADWIRAATDIKRTDPERVRAVEIVTEIHGGWTDEELRTALASLSGPVRARAVWSWGTCRVAIIDGNLLQSLLADPVQDVGAAALEACLVAPELPGGSNWMPGLAGQLGSDRRENRWLASRLCVRLRPDQLPVLSAAAASVGTSAVLAYSVGYLATLPEGQPDQGGAIPQVALQVLERPSTVEQKREATRLLQLWLGDVGVQPGVPPAFEGYTARRSLSDRERELDEVRIRLAGVYPAEDVLLDRELGRLLAMLRPANDRILDSVLAKITPESHPVDDIHHLLIAARIFVTRNARQREATANALLGLDGKIAAQKLPRDTNWNDRIKDLYKELVARDELLPQVLVQLPSFGKASHVLYMSEVPGELLMTAVTGFVRQIEADPDYQWTSDVIFVLTSSPEPAHRQMAVRQFERFAVRGAVVIALAESPRPEERGIFAAGLDHPQIETVQAAVDGLAKLGGPAGPEDMGAFLRLVRRLGEDEREIAVRDRAAGLVVQGVALPVAYQPGLKDRAAQAANFQNLMRAVLTRYPSLILSDESADEEATLRDMLAKVDWSAGDAARGAKLYRERNCAQCHGGSSAVGPDLSGVAGRFSRDDLFTAILFPSRDVSSRYQTTVIQTTEGRTFTGMIVYESVDGLLLRNGVGQTARIEAREIEERRRLPTSLMPKGLLDKATLADYADLYAYLQSLGANR